MLISYRPAVMFTLSFPNPALKAGLARGKLQVTQPYCQFSSSGHSRYCNNTNRKKWMCNKLNDNKKTKPFCHSHWIVMSTCCSRVCFWSQKWLYWKRRVHQRVARNWRNAEKVCAIKMPHKQQQCVWCLILARLCPCSEITSLQTVNGRCLWDIYLTIKCH